MLFFLLWSFCHNSNIKKIECNMIIRIIHDLPESDLHIFTPANIIKNENGILMRHCRQTLHVVQ